MDNVEIVMVAHASLGEGPCWDERARVLWWVDMIEKTLHRHDPHTKLDSVFDIGKSIGRVVQIPAVNVTSCTFGMTWVRCT